MTVQLDTLPDHRTRTIIVGGAARKPLNILQSHLESLSWQELPPRTRLLPIFVPDFAPDQTDAEVYLREWVGERGGEILRSVPSAVGDFSDLGGSSHNWSLSSMARCGQNKNKILQRALHLRADAVWLIDSDVICDRTTIASLIAAERPITCGVYHTIWGKPVGETTLSVSGPQVWLQHPYQLAGRGMEEWEFRAKLIRRELTQVWGLGACTLIDRKVLEAGINFNYVEGVPLQGLMAGEDRHFCIRAERAHIPMHADAWPDQFHVYARPDDERRIPEMLARLGTPHPQKAVLGDLVSLKIQALEPLPTQRGLQHMAPYPVRGRLGTIPMLMELEESVYSMTRGQSVIVRAHCPVSHPLPYFRGRARLYRLTLVDCKPLCYPPVLERELFVGPHSGKWIDRATITPQLEAGIVEQVA